MKVSGYSRICTALQFQLRYHANDARAKDRQLALAMNRQSVYTEWSRRVTKLYVGDKTEQDDNQARTRLQEVGYELPHWWSAT
jgi:hypothetical protein